jgi:hypothetical protein
MTGERPSGSHPGNAIDLRALARELAPLVAAELARALLRVADPSPATYSTRRGHAPPGWSDRAWKRAAPTIPGAYVPRAASGGASRWWQVPRAAFDAWQASLAPAQSIAAKPANESSGAWSPLAALVEAGLRPTR